MGDFVKKYGFLIACAFAIVPFLAISQVYNIFQPGGNLAASYTTCASGSTWNCQALGTIPANTVLANNTASTANPIATSAPQVNVLGVGGVPTCTASTNINVCTGASTGLIVLYNSTGTNPVWIAEQDATGGGNGGVLTVASANGSAPNGLGGSFDMYAGAGKGSGAGGSMAVQTGSSNGSGQGGLLFLTAGGSSSGPGGNITMTSGPSTTGAAGNISVTGGNSGNGGNNDGGTINFTSGNGGGTGNGGAINFTGGTGGNAAGAAGGSLNFVAGNDGSTATSTGGNIAFSVGFGFNIANSGQIQLFDANGDQSWTLDQFGNAVTGMNTAANSTDQFLYVGQSIGTPTGIPAHITGFWAGSIPFRYDTTNNQVCFYNAAWQCATVKPVLAATSASIGGALLAAGACASTATTVTGAAVGMDAISTPNTYPGDSAFWKSYVSGSNTVTTLICESVSGTPTSSTYNVRVIQ